MIVCDMCGTRRDVNNVHSYCGAARGPTPHLWIDKVETASPPPVAPVMPVPESMREAARIYEDRAPLYSDNYKHAGEVLLGLFPRGLELETADDFNRFHLVVHMASKLSRYCMNLKAGGHEDSLKDLSVYAHMALECDREEALRKTPPPTDAEVVKAVAASLDGDSWRGTGGFRDMKTGERTIKEG